ncbi:MAG: Trm112 family protein [Ardenticatenia bacterium]|nr:Trm112 family protein [Ardenticatenia bacterium]
MKRVLKWVLGISLVAALGAALTKYLCREPQEPQAQQEAAGESPQATSSPVDTFDEEELGGEVDPELLEILVDPGDKGPLELSEDGKWLINPRNGYRYPIRQGIPVMLLDVGEKYRDPSLIRETTESE